MKQTKNDFMNKVIDHAEILSRIIQESFNKSVKGGTEEIEVKNEENIKEMLWVNCEYLFGTAVAVSTQFVSDSEEFEEKVIEMIMEKFSFIRQMNKEAANGITRTVE